MDNGVRMIGPFEFTVDNVGVRVAFDATLAQMANKNPDSLDQIPMALQIVANRIVDTRDGTVIKERN